MTKDKLLALSLFGSAAMIASAVIAQPADAGRKFTTSLTGAAEVPGPGDTDGTGTASIAVNVGQKRVCFELEVKNIAAATAAHIHRGAATVAGPVVVGLDAPTDGDSDGCKDVSRELAQEILKDPSAFYVNVHNADFPNGAVRGQLGR